MQILPIRIKRQIFSPIKEGVDSLVAQGLHLGGPEWTVVGTETAGAHTHQGYTCQVVASFGVLYNSTYILRY